MICHLLLDDDCLIPFQLVFSFPFKVRHFFIFISKTAIATKENKPINNITKMIDKIAIFILERFLSLFDNNVVQTIEILVALLNR